MKFKHVIASFALAAVASIGVAAGLSAKKEAKSVAADGDKTWMFRAILNLDTCSPSYDPCAFPEDKPVDGAKFHYWGVGFDKYEEAYYQSELTFTYYAANISLEDDQVITGAQWIIHQKDVGDLYSVNIDKFGDYANSSLDKTTSYIAIQWQFSNNWDGDHWKFMNDNNWGYPCTTFQFHEQNETEIDFTMEPGINAFTIRNFEYNSSHWIEWISNGSVELDGAFCEMVDEDSEKYVYSGSRQWMSLKESGTYDFIVYSGFVKILKHGTTDSYIYYVTQSSEACTDRLYTFGYNESHGDWSHSPRIADIPGVEEYFGSSDDFKFNYDNDHQGLSRRVYKIPLTIGYPADDKLIITNDSREVQTGNMDIIGGTAYVWEPYNEYTNINIAKALEFVLAAEELRTAASMSSVCNVSAQDAKDLYDEYLALTVPQQEIVNRCVVWTWADKEMSSSKDVSYALVVEMFGIRGGVITDSSSFNFNSADNNSIMIIIITISAVSLASIATLLVLKKKRK